MAHWTADEFAMAARALKLGHNVSDEIMGDALRIAVAVMSDDVLYAAWEAGDGRIGRKHITGAVRDVLCGDGAAIEQAETTDV